MRTMLGQSLSVFHQPYSMSFKSQVWPIALGTVDELYYIHVSFTAFTLFHDYYFLDVVFSFTMWMAMLASLE